MKVFKNLHTQNAERGQERLCTEVQQTKGVND